MKSKHHVRPRSRRGATNKTVKLPDGFHKALHIVFGNLHGQEFILFITELNRLMETRDMITGEQLESIRDKIKRTY